MVRWEGHHGPGGPQGLPASRAPDTSAEGAAVLPSWAPSSIKEKLNVIFYYYVDIKTYTNIIRYNLDFDLKAHFCLLILEEVNT